MIKKTLLTLIIGSLVLTFLLPQTVFAQNETTAPNGSAMVERLKRIAGDGGYNTDPDDTATPRVVGVIVGLFIGFTGLTFLVLMVIAGYTWMTASGNEEKVKKAKSTITTAIIGLIVALSAWIIWNFIYTRLIE